MFRKILLSIVTILLVSSVSSAFAYQLEWELVTRPEKTRYTETSTHKDVTDFINYISSNPLVNVETIATSKEGRRVAMVILADPPISSPAEAVISGKPVVYVQANIHGGEVEGKEAVMLIMREILYGDKKYLLDNQILLINPMYNTDGNDKMADNIRSSQEGSPILAGSRHNSEDWDLNRDGMKMDAIETKGLMKNVIIKWDPILFVDLHTTNGTWHGYPLTYAPNYLSGGHPATSNYLLDEFLPSITTEIKQKYDLDMFLYGSFRTNTWPPKAWRTYNHHPRYLVNYMGMRNKMGILGETFAHDRFYKRIHSAYAFASEIIEYTNKHGKEIQEINTKAGEETVQYVLDNAGKVKKGARFEMVAFDRAITLKAYDYQAYKNEKGETRYFRKGNIVDVPGVKNYSAFKPTVSTTLPRGYIIPAEWKNIADKLKEHGIKVETLSSEIKVKGEEFTATKITHARRQLEKHKLAHITGEYKMMTKKFPAGSYLVDMADPLANLIFYLLEPESDDGLAAWNYYDEWLLNNGIEKKGVVFPIFKFIEIDK